MKGIFLSLTGFILMLGAAGASDADVSLGRVIAVLLIGFALFAAGITRLRMAEEKH